MTGTRYRSVISGQDASLGGFLKRIGLSLIEPLYATASGLHRLIWNTGLRQPARLSRPVISIGNLTAGGTGKTPLTAWIAGILTSRNLKPVVLMRGYRSTGGKSDEQILLQEQVPGLPVLAQPDRVQAAQHHLSQQKPCDLFLLDDGFQHHRLHRDLNLVLIDALCPFGHNRLLPRGLLREPLHALKRADAVVITRADQIAPDALEQLDRQIAGILGQSALARAAFRWNGFLNELNQPVMPPDQSSVLAACGIGHPESFFHQAEEFFRLTDSIAFPDHHPWTSDDLNRLTSRAAAAGATALLVSGKDWVKIRDLIKSALKLPVWRPQVVVSFLSGERDLENRILSLLPESSRTNRPERKA